jgi:hypothetical protein
MSVIFSPHQIVRLECDQTQLYAEVIQVLETRQMCWVRPIVLVRSAPSVSADFWKEADQAADINWVTEGPDLLWPLSQFNLALDTEVIPLLAAGQAPKPDIAPSPHTPAQLLGQFVEKLWAKQFKGDSSSGFI